MRPLSASELLNAWERGLGEPRSTRSLALLAAASSDDAPEVLVQLSIGQRDARLLTLREWAFGSQLVCVASCPNCRERLEWFLNADELRVEPQTERAAKLSLDRDGYSVSFRLPNALDLAAGAGSKDVDAARLALLERCVIAATHDDQATSAAELPTQIVEALAELMSQADPQADMRLDLDCLACGHRWQAIFDSESFFWSEINAWAKRLLTDVHKLASVYGWSESDILSMSPWRRQVYLNLLNG